MHFLTRVHFTLIVLLVFTVVWIYLSDDLIIYISDHLRLFFLSITLFWFAQHLFVFINRYQLPSGLPSTIPGILEQSDIGFQQRIVSYSIWEGKFVHKGECAGEGWRFFLEEGFERETLTWGITIWARRRKGGGGVGLYWEEEFWLMENIGLENKFVLGGWVAYPWPLNSVYYLLLITYPLIPVLCVPGTPESGTLCFTYPWPLDSVLGTPDFVHYA